MNWTIIAICSALLILSTLLFAAGIGIGMSIKSESEKQDTFKKFKKWLERNKEETK